MRAKFPVRRSLTFLPVLLLIFSATSGFAQPSDSVGITWEVKNRFRLFKNEDDFIYVKKFHGSGGVFAEETALAADTNGNGWAAPLVEGDDKSGRDPRLCIDGRGGLADICTRDYVALNGSDRKTIRESYLNPAKHRIEVKLQGTLPVGARCSWKLVTDGDETTAKIKRDQPEQPCRNEIFDVPYGKTTQVQLFVATNPEDSQPTATADVRVRDILIAGLGDSTASGEGDPDRAIDLDYQSFCFKRYLSGAHDWYYRPNRLTYRKKYHGKIDCAESSRDDFRNWTSSGALWMDRACHRSLYSYQVRVALELAIENEHIAVTYIPLGCSGATIKEGMLDKQSARETKCVPDTNCRHPVKGQIGTLEQILNLAHQRDKNRNLDLLLLTVGANDIHFSGLVANVMVQHDTFEFTGLQNLGKLSKKSGIIANVDDAKKALNDLSGEFSKLRRKLKPLLDNKLERVVFVSYGHPALHNNGQPCETTRQGFDVHPAFGIDGELLKATADFVTNDFFPHLKALATCGTGGGCQSVAEDHMTFVDDHQAQFKDHGFCAQANDDPAFDQECFTDGNSFKRVTKSDTSASTDPLTCPQPANMFRAYASRQRWIRTANDSYFTAMTYPDGAFPLGLLPDDIHDPFWGVLSAVYGGAVHPTAQGYAAMADFALPAARSVLGLPVPQAASATSGSNSP
jgi:lysophospholipase L1-like esterase